MPDPPYSNYELRRFIDLPLFFSAVLMIPIIWFGVVTLMHFHVSDLILFVIFFVVWYVNFWTCGWFGPEHGREYRHTEEWKKTEYQGNRLWSNATATAFITSFLTLLLVWRGIELIFRFNLNSLIFVVLCSLCWVISFSLFLYYKISGEPRKEMNETRTPQPLTMSA
jgi:cation transport ATPase